MPGLLVDLALSFHDQAKVRVDLGDGVLLFLLGLLSHDLPGTDICFSCRVYVVQKPHTFDEGVICDVDVLLTLFLVSLLVLLEQLQQSALDPKVNSLKFPEPSHHIPHVDYNQLVILVTLFGALELRL